MSSITYSKSDVSPEQAYTWEAGYSFSGVSRVRSVSEPSKAIAAGLGLTLLQIVIAVLLLAPQGPLQYRYQSLVQHDSYWFLNIVERGYQTIVPPMSHKLMEVSNTAFFPAYPMMAAGLRYGFGIQGESALLIAAQLSACGFWIYFFLLCDRWSVQPGLQLAGALSIAAHPAAFFLIAAYSESLFLMALLGFLYWAEVGNSRAKALAIAHGAMMSATRIVGLPCALAPLVRRVWEGGWNRLRDRSSWPRTYGSAILVSAGASVGSLAFFVYCQLRWGHWNIYMLTQQFGWGIEPDYLAVFKPSSYRWLLPALDNPTEASQMAMTLGGLLLVAEIGCDLLRPGLRPASRSIRVPFYFAAVALYFISVSGVACVDMESMLRYQFCVHAVVVVAFLHYLANVPLRSPVARAGAVSAVALISAFGLSLQSWYIWNFTRGNWVA